MKRLLILAISVLGMGLIFVPQAHAAVNNFVISDYQVEYHLTKDDDNHSKLKTIETITTQFTIPNQNHGIERAIPKSFDNHSTHLNIVSVTDENLNSLTYVTRTENDNLVVRIGDADTYVIGQKTYIITYMQQDVTKFYSDTQRDEFYWDINGTEWAVPITKLSTTLHVDDAMGSAITGDTACYQGFSGERGDCILNRTNTDFAVYAKDLQAGENVSIAVGFTPHTFAEYKPTKAEVIAGLALISNLVAIPVSLLLIVVLIVRFNRWTNRKGERGSIVTEYLPPKDTSVSTAATVIKAPKAVFTAQLIDFAVRHYLKIYQTREKSFMKTAEYDIEVVKDVSNLKVEEREILSDIFGSLPKVGDRLALKTLKNNTAVYSRTLNNARDLKKLVRGQYELRNKVAVQSGWFKKFGYAMLILGLVLLNIPLVITAIIALIMGYILWPLTDKGLALSQYLDGLKQYISVAETERLQQMQSPEGAVKLAGIDVQDAGQLVKLYERVLPYAVLFGQEKDWNKQIGKYYESIGSSPEWYAGNNAVFNAAVFSSAMSSFSTAATYSSASSSSSGGSSGGGSSGGGGGGGGGGGW